ncbi:uncharacterized protein LOC119706472 [Motacilla alba alba]|uniref:uncharacterized protein LOC119706472 n=1 Tax=Motacilla alba alba TaxID=1094192 RepID=UPI0018D53080|nr:uncharacterized protein LOC119706472 [Motacilla alba alba]
MWHLALWAGDQAQLGIDDLGGLFQPGILGFSARHCEADPVYPELREGKLGWDSSWSKVLLELLLGSSAVPAAIHRCNQWSGRKSEITADKPAAATEIGGVGDGAEHGAVMQSNPDCLVNWAHLSKVHFNVAQRGAARGETECWPISWLTLKWIQGSRCMSSSGLRGWHRPQVEKPARLEGQEGTAGSPGEMAPAKVTSDEERGKTGASKDEGLKTDLMFAGCDLDLLCLTPQTEGSGVPQLHCTSSSLCRGHCPLKGSLPSPRKVTPNPISVSQGQTNRFRAFPRFQSRAVRVESWPGHLLVGLGTEGGGHSPCQCHAALCGCRGQGLGALQ